MKKTLSRSDLAPYVVIEGNNGAQIKPLFPHPSAEVRELNPELKAAYEKLEAQNAKAVALGAEERALIKRRVELRRSRSAAELYDQDLDDELTRNLARIDRDRTVIGRKAKQLALDYLELVEANRANTTTQARAAALALEAHLEAAEAFAKLESALQRRDLYYDGAGAPSVWKHHTYMSRLSHNDGDFARAHHMMSREVSEFPVEDTRTVADGGSVPSLQEYQSLSRAAYGKSVAEGKAAGRNRDKAREIAARNAAN